jgi:hypothetical protein
MKSASLPAHVSLRHWPGNGCKNSLRRSFRE